MTLYTVQFSLKNRFYTLTKPLVSMITIDVFALSEEDAITLAKGALTQPNRYSVDDITEY